MKLLTTLFGFDPKAHSVKTEIFAGITTFLTMAYILAVNPEILSSTGMNREAVFTATALASILATVIMSVWAKLPFAQAPGMGLNAFFAYTICLNMGYSWQFALTAVFVEGILFILLTVSNLRTMIVDAIPESLKYATTVGIGLFIAFIGLQNAGIVVSNPSTMLSLGHITSGAPLLAIIGMAVTLVLLVHRVRGGLLWGILITTAVGIPMGITSFQGVCNLPPSVAPVFCQLDFTHLWSADMIIVVCTLLFMDLFDTIGAFIGVATRAGMMKDGQLPRAKQAFMSDAIGHGGRVAGYEHHRDLSRKRCGRQRRRAHGTDVVYYGCLSGTGIVLVATVSLHPGGGHFGRAHHRRHDDAQSCGAHRPR